MKPLKARLRGREMTLGSWLAFPCEATAEVMARAGFEWLVIDMEHAPFGVEDAARLIRIVDLAGLPVLCRLPSNDPALTKTLLDAGAHGIIVPSVQSAAEARQAVDAVYYPPRGKRGVGLGRAQAYGREFETYRSRIDDSLIVIAMIETRAGVEHVKEIAGTDGIDGLLIGPYDLSGSYGRIGQLDHPDLLAAKQRVLDAAAKADIGSGLHVVHTSQETIERAVGEGYSYLVVGVDMILLNAAARTAAELAARATRRA
jgi:2-dehydro-3-deoxyglucarate aldolase